VYSNRLKWTWGNFLNIKYSCVFTLRLLVRLKNLQSTPSVPVGPTMTCRQLHIVVCAALSLNNTSLPDDTHSPLHRTISCCVHSWSLSLTPPQYSHHYLTDVMICALHTAVLCPWTLGTLLSLPCENALRSLLSWSEMQFWDRLTNWKMWKLNILLYLKVVTPCVF
jgi:hypothetical protein